MYGRCRRLQGGVVGSNGGRGRIMSRVPGWIGRIGAGLTEVGDRLDARRAAAEKDDDADEVGIVKDGTDGTDLRSPSPSSSLGTVVRPDPATAVPWGVRV